MKSLNAAKLWALMILFALTVQGRGAISDSGKPAGRDIPTASARFELTSPERGLLLRSVIDTATGTQFMPQAEEGRSLWEIVLVSPERKLTSVRAQPGATFDQARQAAGDEVYRLCWPQADLPDEPGALTVEITVLVPAENRTLSQWTLRVTNRSQVWGVWEVRFPRFEGLGPIATPAEDCFLDPHTTGRLTANPYRNLEKPHGLLSMDLESGRTSYAQEVEETGQKVHYPGYASFQMCALYAPGRAGLYYAAYDGQGYYKQFCFGPTKDGQSLDLYLNHFPEGQGLPGTGYVSPFPVVIGTFQGDWLTAARIYRQWAQRQIWCSAGVLERRSDVPRWYKDLAIWEFITANSYDAMRYYQALLGGLPWANHWNYLWKDAGQGDRGSPDLFPPKGGEEQMRAETAQLQAAGIYTVPYFLGSALDVNSPQYAEWEMEKYLVRGGEAHYALEDPQVPYRWFYPQTQFAWPCPHLDAWPDKAVEIVRHIMELGVSGVYLDTTTGNAYQCFSREHGHPVGGGNYWAQGVRRYLARLRQTVKEINPQGIMTGENPCEIYNDLMDGYLLFNHDWPDRVPAFQAIYHDYVGTYGQFLATSAKIGEDYPFMLPMGLSFINGNQLGCTARTDYTLSNNGAADMAWLRRLAHFRAKVVHRYVGLGEMLRPPKLGRALPEVSGWWRTEAHVFTCPAVIHSAWQASDGRIGIVFLNISEQPQTIAFRLQGLDYGFPPGLDLAVTGLTLSPKEEPVREPLTVLEGGAGPIERLLEGRGMWAVEVARAGAVP